VSDFDRNIERELGRVLGPVESSSSIPAWNAPISGGFMKGILGGTGAAIAAKVVTGFAIGALAAVGATETAITGSVNPNDWGQQVVQQVAKCKAALQTGQHGIGQCVSAFAKQHGPTVSADHRASGARTNTGDNGNGNGNGKGKGNGHGKPANPGSQGPGDGQPGDKSHGRPTPSPAPVS
jgi:hypothetical protein